MLKKILGLLVKNETKIPHKVAEETDSYQDKENGELLNRIKKLEEQQKEMIQSQTNKSEDEENYFLTEKQKEYAFSIIEKINDYELSADPSKLTIKDLNRLIAYNRYKNVGAVVNLEKKGILKKKQKVKN
ncbi:hypothetical protein LCL95_09120 [Bacillus timonensis]|nr:hypothetical protein [Bacillus timonensis]